MKLLTLNFLTCARKTCKSSATSFPLHPREAELEQIEMEINPIFIRNILSRIDWTAMKTVTEELGLPNLPTEMPSPEDLGIDNNSNTDGSAAGEASQTLKDLHVLLMETSIASGKLACANCGHEYAVKEGIANFLLPSHMV